mmetsp:Transcript_23476/g.35642  ORF Transcript_23476/g.35642 Transcript_23476/m.35642 type:complete len:104 (+) Transcript_23476:352-663(+)
MASSDRSPQAIAALIGSAIATIGWAKLEENLLVWLRAMLTAFERSRAFSCDTATLHSGSPCQRIGGFLVEDCNARSPHLGFSRYPQQCAANLRSHRIWSGSVC